MKKAVNSRKLFIFLSVLLSFTLLLQSGAVAAPISAAAEEIISSAPIETTEKAVIQSEEIALRNEFEKHFVMSDGTGLAIAYADPVHEELSDGSWKEIDNTLSLVDGRYRNSAEGFKASFAQSSSTQQLVSVESKGYTLSWSLSMLKANLGYEVMSRTNTATGAELQAVAPIASAALVENPVRSSFNQLSDTEIIESAAAPSKLTYANAFGSGINIEYGVKAYGVKENVILQNANTGFRGYKVHIASAGLTAQKDETNAIVFSDAEGNIQFTVQAPYMLDAADNVSGDIAVTLTQTATGYDITYIPNAQWLSEAIYPMAINSSANSSQAASNLIDTYTYEGDSTADSSTRENLDRMFVGNKAVSGTSRKHLGYFKFKTIPTIPTGKAFQSASVVLRCPNGTETSQPFDLYDVPRDWVTTDFCWSNRPVATYKLCTAAIRNTSTNDVLFFGTGNNRHLSILVGNWYTGIYANYGFMVCYTSASDSVADYNAFYTSNCSTTNVRPYLIVNYETMDSAVSNGTYYIRNVSTGKYLTVNGNGASGSNVVPAGFSGLSTQRWIVTKLSDGNYKLSPAINTSVRLLNDGSRPTDGNNISVHSGYYGLSMEFSISYNLDSNGNPVYGQYRIGTRITGGNSFVADIGTNIVQKNYANNNNQVWVFESTEENFSIPSTYEVYKGWSGKLPITYYPASATNQNITWTSSDSYVATINGSTGQIAAYRSGTTVIRAYKNGELINTCNLTVKYALNSNDSMITDTNTKNRIIHIGTMIDTMDLAYLNGEISLDMRRTAISDLNQEYNVVRADYIATGSNPTSSYAYAVLGGNASSSIPFAFSRNLKLGDVGLDVVVMQRALEVLGYYEPKDGEQYGTFDQNTYDAASSYNYLLSYDSNLGAYIFDAASFNMLFQASTVNLRTYEKYNELNRFRLVHDYVAQRTAEKVGGTYKRSDNRITNGNAGQNYYGYADVLKDTGSKTYIWEVKPNDVRYYREYGIGQIQMQRYLTSGNAYTQSFTKPLVVGYNIGSFSMSWLNGEYINVESYTTLPTTDARNGLVLYSKAASPQYALESVPVLVDEPSESYTFSESYSITSTELGNVPVAGVVVIAGMAFLVLSVVTGTITYAPIAMLAV